MAQRAFLIALLLTAVLLTLGAAILPSGLGSSQRNHYELYSQALLEGRLWVRDAEKIQDCPYDMALVGGKCYMYQGIPPAVFHWIPGVSDHLVCILFCGLAIYFFLRILFELSQVNKRDDFSVWIPPIGVAVLAIALLPIALVGRMYEEAILVGAAFGLMGIHFLLPFLLGESAHGKKFWWGMLALGLAGVTRPPWIFALGGVSAFFLFRDRKVGFIFPGLLAGLTLAFINWARFGNPFEFGLKFTSAVYGWESPYGVLSLHFLLQNLAIYLFFGFFTFSRYHSWIMEQFRHGLVCIEFPLALFLLAPILLYVMQRGWREMRGSSPLLFAFVPLSLPCLLSSGQVHRYQLEALGMFLVVLIPVWVSLSRKFHWKWINWAALGWALAVNIENSRRLLLTLWDVL